MKKIFTLVQVCDHYRIDINLARELADFGLYPTTELAGEKAVEARHLDKIKKVICLSQVLGINKEGIDIILELRGIITELHQELENLYRENRQLKNMLGSDAHENPEIQEIYFELHDD